jgi:hypothetical protein
MSLRRTRKNRTKPLQNLVQEVKGKQKFEVQPPLYRYFEGQAIRLFAPKLANNFPGQILKEFDPSEYLRQKQKLRVEFLKRHTAYTRRPQVASHRPQVASRRSQDASHRRSSMSSTNTRNKKQLQAEH